MDVQDVNLLPPDHAFRPKLKMQITNWAKAKAHWLIANVGVLLIYWNSYKQTSRTSSQPGF